MNSFALAGRLSSSDGKFGWTCDSWHLPHPVWAGVVCALYLAPPHLKENTHSQKIPLSQEDSFQRHPPAAIVAASVLLSQYPSGAHFEDMPAGTGYLH